jgi:4-hydroxybenzoate polyprenyltransferase
LSLAYALATIPERLSLCCLIGKLVSDLFLGALLAYFAISLAYPFLLKKIVVLDVIILASLYSVQITRAWAGNP